MRGVPPSCPLDGGLSEHMIELGFGPATGAPGPHSTLTLCSFSTSGFLPRANKQLLVLPWLGIGGGRSHVASERTGTDLEEK